MRKKYRLGVCVLFLHCALCICVFVYFCICAVWLFWYLCSLHFVFLLFVFLVFVVLAFLYLSCFAFWYLCCLHFVFLLFCFLVFVHPCRQSSDSCSCQILERGRFYRFRRKSQPEMISYYQIFKLSYIFSKQICVYYIFLDRDLNIIILIATEKSKRHQLTLQFVS